MWRKITPEAKNKVQRKKTDSREIWIMKKCKQHFLMGKRRQRQKNPHSFRGKNSAPPWHELSWQPLLVRAGSALCVGKPEGRVALPVFTLPQRSTYQDSEAPHDEHSSCATTQCNLLYGWFEDSDLRSECLNKIWNIASTLLIQSEYWHSSKWVSSTSSSLWPRLPS